MSLRSAISGLSLLASLAAADLSAMDRNWWPVRVERDVDQTATPFWQGAGPLAFYQPLTEGRTAHGLRPLVVWRQHENGAPAGGTALYPLVRWEKYPDGHTWTIFNLVNSRRTETESGAGDVAAFDVWPFYFSRQTGDPATSYRAVFPLYGDVKNRFGQDRWRWVLFPFYGRFEQNGVTTTTAPWPFIKVLRGDGNRGFEFWPLGGHRAKPGAYRADYALWPLLYRTKTGLDQPTPNVQAGFLPFYAIDRRPGYVSETFGWPFWGYVDRTEPYRYHSKHYFWPFWVQGRGDHRYVNRWAPFYTHSIIRDSDKTWIMWPLWRHHTWADSGLAHERRQFLYFLYHSTEQRRPTNAAVAPAKKTHVWPLFSTWHNGAGRRQIQALSPLEVFFPHNEHVRTSYSPFFALYRYDQTAPGELRHSLLWDAVTYERSRENQRREFHLGPLLEVSGNPTARTISLLNGLIGLQRTAERARWRWFIFGKPKPADPAVASSP
ncbi:MAG TPA: hypothetical protein VHF69_00135 [Candidatus Synoicihabitans sp.]|nr:hypothetical protein [Candidatus Synoicihabitans sp.]